MKTIARLILALALASASTFAMWVMVMEYANFRLGVPLAVRLVVMAPVMGLVGLGLGARTARIQRRLPPVLLAVAAAFPLVAWRAFQFATYHAGNPAMTRLWLREFAIIVFTMVVPCAAGIHWIWSLARK
jgi:hypothetical protein